MTLPWTIWGVDYDNGSTYHKWGSATSDQSDAYYNGSTSRYPGTGYAMGHIDSNLDKGPWFRTNCNYASDAMIYKTDLYFEQALSSRYGRTEALSKKGRITKVSDLQVGDMVHYFIGGSWKHVTLVGEVYSDYVVLYDGGSKFINTKQYKKKVPRYGSMLNGTPYSGYDSWFAVRMWDIDQSKVLEGLK